MATVVVERYKRNADWGDKSSPERFYLRQTAKSCHSFGLDELSKAIEAKCAISKGDVNHVIEELMLQIQQHLVSGDKVVLGDLGTFYMTFSCPGVATKEECSVRNITKVNVRFKPSKALRLVNAASLSTKADGAVTFELYTPKSETSDGGSTGSGSNGGSGSGDEEEVPFG